MAHAVDFVLDTMRELSSLEPVLFQRDRSLYVASDAGLGQITYGLPIREDELESWEKRESYQKRGKAPEIVESENVILRWIGKFHKKPVYKKDDKPYIKEIVFGPDYNSFTLEDVKKAAKRLSELPDDNKIRMVSHRTGYHSHKYGYATDGMDVWVEEARVMDRDRYLELVRQREDKILQNMEEEASRVREMKDVDNIYRNLALPSCAILTPHIMVSLPRGGMLNPYSYGDNRYSWTNETRLKPHNDDHTNGSILHLYQVENDYEFPFSVNVTTNVQSIKAVNNKVLFKLKDEALSKTDEELNLVILNMPKVEGFIDRINSLHNKIAMPRIEFYNRLRVKE